MRDLGSEPPEVAVARIAAEQHGVVSSAQLRACGLDADAVRRRVVAGRLHRVHRGVYAVGHAALTLHGRFMAAVLACGPDAVLSHWAAAILWELLDEHKRRPDVIAPTDKRHLGIRAHRDRLDPRDVTRHHGIPVTTATRTLLSLAESMPPKALRRPTRQALAKRLTSIPWLLDVCKDNNGHQGIGNLRAVVAGGHVPTRSELEDVVHDLILRAGIGTPATNEPLVLDGRRVIPDFLVAEHRLVIEADSRTWHDDPLARADDADRQALLEAHDPQAAGGYEIANTAVRSALTRVRPGWIGVFGAGRATLSAAPYS